MFNFKAIIKKGNVEDCKYFEGKNLEDAKIKAEEEISECEDETVLVDIEWCEGQKEKAILMESGLTWREAEKAIANNTVFIFDSLKDFFLSDEFVEEEFEESGKTEEEFLKDIEDIELVEFEGKKMVIQFVV